MQIIILVESLVPGLFLSLKYIWVGRGGGKVKKDVIISTLQLASFWGFLLNLIE